MNTQTIGTEMLPREHELKLWSSYFRDVASGKKSFEVRCNDRDFRVGDTLRLREWIVETESYSGHECTRQISYVLSATDFLKDGFVVLALKNQNLDYQTWYEEAMVASNEAGFAGVDAAQTIRALAEDTARLDWLLPIVTGADNPETDRRTMALGLALMLGQDGRTAIDTARASA